ncbi:MAG: phytoene/squalene synthase family protein [Verrucomicrobiales bacterium]
MKKDLDQGLLRDVSRSFYLSLRILPAPMRPGVSLAYLLARASDTLADTVSVEVGKRLKWLEGFIREMDCGGREWREGLAEFSAQQKHEGERLLLERLDEVFDALDRAPSVEQSLIRDVVAVITGGQRLDVVRFGAGAHSLETEEELEDYCYRVAGVVGEFWTSIGFATLGHRFSTSDADQLRSLGEEFGRGLQLVNILRDMPADLAAGRCYLPVVDRGNREELLAEAARWRRVARQRMKLGRIYAAQMRSRRLRVAVALQAILGERTLDLLDGADWTTLTRGVKVSRSVVRRALWDAWWIS